MTSIRPTEAQDSFDFGDEIDVPNCAAEPQRGESASAAMKKRTLSDSTDLMERIDAPANMERAWKNVNDKYARTG